MGDKRLHLKVLQGGSKGNRTLCRGCGRPLRSAKSITLGYGRTCFYKWSSKNPKQRALEKGGQDRIREELLGGQLKTKGN